MSGNYLFTSESVSDGHPDKLADRISDTVLDRCLTLDPLAKVACETLLAAQLAASTVMYLTFFRLQAVGGPTYLSQIGYVAAAVGVGAGLLFLGERYPPLVWMGIAVVAAGIGLSTLAQAKSRPLR